MAAAQEQRDPGAGTGHLGADWHLGADGQCIAHPGWTDPLREQKLLVLALSPCPPLPVQALREHDGSHVVTYVSVHDIMAAGMTQFRDMLENASEKDAALREAALMTQQQASHEKLVERLDELWRERGDTPNRELIGDVYEAMQHYARERVAGYMPWRKDPPDLIFGELDSVPKGSLIHQRMVDYIMLNRDACGTRKKKRAFLERKSFLQLVWLHWQMMSLDGEDEAAGRAQMGIEVDVNGMPFEAPAIAEDAEAVSDDAWAPEPPAGSVDITKVATCSAAWFNPETAEEF